MSSSRRSTGEFSPLQAGLPATTGGEGGRRSSRHTGDTTAPATVVPGRASMTEAGTEDVQEQDGRRSRRRTAEQGPLGEHALWQHYPVVRVTTAGHDSDGVKYPAIDAAKRDSRAGEPRRGSEPGQSQPDNWPGATLAPRRTSEASAQPTQPQQEPRRQSRASEAGGRAAGPHQVYPAPYDAAAMQPGRWDGERDRASSQHAQQQQTAGAGDAGGRRSSQGAAPKQESPPGFSAYPFNDPELGSALDKAGGLGMLGHRFHRQTTINWYAWFLYAFYLAALGYYLYVRITKSLGLGPYFTWYGIVLLVIECMGASTVLIYGLWLLYSPVQEDFVADPEHPGKPKVRLQYHIRVMIPCYKEELDIVQRTVLAALDADLPAGCERTVYLCDDGKDPEKRRWAQGLGPEVVYVSGRVRQQGEMNGKSGNLNNCARQLYPVEVPIPGNELICIFDADQVARKEFFLRMVPLFDAGDDVAMALSPQCFHNLNYHTDIFNHSNLQFWEYMQPGYDAWGFISCTGTNFLVRAKAFMEVGGSPTYTLTEDFALGMELKKYGWQCRYVQEYLAVGEAPDEIRNCFQQRSRWTKGHFQIILNPKHSPLLQWRLRLFDRLMYCSGCWSYTVGAVTTPVFIAIPFLTIWIGVFPVVISRPFALALTIYTIATQMLLYYVRSPLHFEALWFANVANAILWWAFVKAWWRALITRLCCCCSRMAFKATAKGHGKLQSSITGDIWLHCLAVVLLTATIGIGVWQLVAGAKALSPLLISVLWAVYAIIPPFLLCAYAAVGGPGIIMHMLCFLAALISTATGLAAVGILWAIPKYNSAEFSGGLVSQEDIGVLFRFVHNLGQH